jgi:hypothetical protein
VKKYEWYEEARFCLEGGGMNDLGLSIGFFTYWEEDMRLGS